MPMAAPPTKAAAEETQGVKARQAPSPSRAVVKGEESECLIKTTIGKTASRKQINLFDAVSVFLMFSQPMGKWQQRKNILDMDYNNITL
jgi:hypothetical protein